MGIKFNGYRVVCLSFLGKPSISNKKGAHQKTLFDSL